MIKISLIIFGLILSCINSIGQTQEKIVYIVDSIPVIEDPEEGNEILENDIADITVVENKDTLHILGYNKFDKAIFIFTKEYRKINEEFKKIPSSKQMEVKNGVWYFKGIPYSGKFIDYYYSGRK